ncbi:MAG: hypothetical protein ACHQT8_00155 [Chlamydiales bacterium]
MNVAALTVCKAFLLKSSQEKKAGLFEKLSFEVQEGMHELATSFYGDPTAGFADEKQLLHAVHYSWLTPAFRAFSENEVKLFFAALTPEQVKGVKQQLLFSNHAPEVNSAALPFLYKTLWSKVEDEDLLPIECLPDSPLNKLLELRTEELHHLIDFLALHDLASQVKQIIDTSRLKQIYAALSPAELTFLNTLLQSKEPLSFKPMELQKWDGKKETLRTLIHQRGINRLAKALFQKEKSLLWYISHKLDIERGELLRKLATPLEHLRAHELLVSQVEEIFPLISTPKEK